MKPSAPDLSLLGLHIGGDLGPVTIYQTKRGKVVAYPIAKPKSKPTAAQNLQRYRFMRAVHTWQDLTDDQQQAYEDTTNVLSLCATGMNIWISLCLTHDIPAWLALKRQANLPLVSFPFV